MSNHKKESVAEKWQLKRCHHEQNGRQIWLTYENEWGGTILLSFDGIGEPNWEYLPANFPVSQAKYIAKNGIMR